MSSTASFELGPGVDLEAIQAALGAELILEQAEDRSEARLHLDTWEARLFRAGWSLHAEAAEGAGARLVLGRLDESASTMLEMGSVPAFAWEFPEGALRERIAPLIKARRLLPLVELGRAVRPYRILGAAGRAIAGLEVDRISAGLPDGSRPPSEASAILEVVELGDSAGFEGVVDRLERCPGLARREGGPLLRALTALGRVPGDNPCKLILELEPEQTAEAALRRICRRMLTAVELTVDGTLRQVDVEFLHDLRVSCRRSRAALSQLKKVFDPASVGRFQADLRWIGDVTGPARDLDVFLLRWQARVEPLGDPDGVALRPLQEILAQRREAVQADVEQALDSARFRAFVADWAVFLDGETGGGSKGGRPVAEVARARIRKRHRKVLARGAAIGPDSPDADLHSMRLDCKKLRYLLEMFRSLYPKAEIGALIRALKQFQDTLGDFNDLSIQQELLAEPGDLDAAARPALDRMLASLRDRQTQLRQLFVSRFDRFAGAEVSATFERLFG